MAVQQRLTAAWPAVVCVAIAALWPLSAYLVSPFALPALLLAGGTTAVVVVRPDIGIAIALALAPWTNMQIGGGGKPFHLLLPAMSFALVGYGLLLHHDEKAPRGSWLAGAVLVFTGVAIASSLQAINPSDSVNKLFILLTASALFFAVLLICRTREQLLVVVTGALAGLLLVSAQGVVEHFSGNFGPYGFVAGGQVVGRVQGSFGHPNQYGGYIAVLLPLAATVVMTKAFKSSTRWLAGAALTLAVPALIFSYARGAIAALLIGSLLWLAIMRPRAAMFTAVAVAVTAILFAPGALRERFSPQGASGDAPLREDIWSSATDIYSRYPILGAGLNNFGDAYANLPATRESASQRRLLHQNALLTPPHAQNLYLNVLAEEGIVGLAALLFLVIMSLATAYRGCHIRDRLGHAICLGLGAGIITLGVHSLLEVTLLGEVALPLFALVAVATVFVARDPSGSNARPRALRRG